MTYCIIGHRHLFCLYRIDVEGPVFLKGNAQWESIISELLQHKPKKLLILDNTSINSIKIETTSRALALHEYLQWAWQKWRHIRQNSLFARVRLLRRYNSILVLTSHFTGVMPALLEKLEPYSLTSSVYNYPLALIMGIHLQYSAHWTSPPLLIILDKEQHVLFAFLLKDRLVFIRQNTLSSTDVHNIGPKNMILDTLRYLEKTFKIQGISPVFFLEDTSWENMLRSFFPNSDFHFPGPFFPKEFHSAPKDLVEGSPDSLAFDRVVLEKISPLSLMHLQGGVFQKSWIQRLVPYIKLVNIVAIMISVYCMYTALCLMSCNQKLGKTLDSLNQSFTVIQKQLSRMPIDSCHIDRIQSIRTLSEHQRKSLIQHFALLEHLLNDRYIIRSISMGPKKSRLSLQMTDPTMTIDDLIDMGQNSLSDFQMTTPPQNSSSTFVVETHSPLFYEKTSY